jgi:hypothetical protein
MSSEQRKSPLGEAFEDILKVLSQKSHSNSEEPTAAEADAIGELMVACSALAKEIMDKPKDDLTEAERTFVTKFAKMGLLLILSPS